MAGIGVTQQRRDSAQPCGVPFHSTSPCLPAGHITRNERLWALTVVTDSVRGHAKPRKCRSFGHCPRAHGRPRRAAGGHHCRVSCSLGAALFRADFRRPPVRGAVGFWFASSAYVAGRHRRDRGPNRRRRLGRWRDATRDPSARGAPLRSHSRGHANAQFRDHAITVRRPCADEPTAGHGEAIAGYPRVVDDRLIAIRIAGSGRSLSRVNAIVARPARFGEAAPLSLGDSQLGSRVGGVVQVPALPS